MDSLCVPLAYAFYSTWLYCLVSYVDSLRNPWEYSTVLSRKHVDVLVLNVFFWVPVYLLVLFLYVPPLGVWRGLGVEIFSLCMEAVFAEVWFYSLHRLCHHRLFYWLHRVHHELRKPLGIHALYASPFDAVVVNLGSAGVSHVLCGGHSHFHAWLVGTYAIVNTILQAHSYNVASAHQWHHLTLTKNYGLDMFMDRLFGTRESPVCIS